MCGVLFLVHSIDSQSRNGKPALSFFFPVLREMTATFWLYFQFPLLVFWTRLRPFVASVVVLAEVQGRKWWCRWPCHWLWYSFFGGHALATPVLFWRHASLNYFCQWLSVLLSPCPGLDLNMVCLSPGLALFLVLLHFGLDSVLVSLGVFWTTPLQQVEPNWNSASFRIRERERYQENVVLSLELLFMRQYTSSDSLM